MKILSFSAVLLLSVSALAASPLTVTVGGVQSNGWFAADHAFCTASGFGPNLSPSVQWSQGPAGTKSYALVMLDPDVPADLSLYNKAGVTIAADAPRQIFPHWLLANIPPTVTQVAEGAEGKGVVKGNLPLGRTAIGTRGQSGYAAFMASNPDMAGDWGGYAGPCPPLNDLRRHEYRIRVYALDVASLPLPDRFTWADLEPALKGHILAEGEAKAAYSLHPAIK